MKMKTTQLNRTINNKFNSRPARSLRSRIGIGFALAAAVVCGLAPRAHAKTLVAGPPLVQVAAGNTQVWGRDGAGNVYQYSGGTFNFIGGLYKQVAVGLNDDVWVLGLKGHAFQWDASTKTFIEVSSTLAFKQLATGKGGTWAITSSGDIYSYNQPLNKFEKFAKGPPPAALEIFVGGAGQAVWILDFGQEPHLYNTRTGFFDLVTGINLQQIAVGYSDTWGLDFSGQPRLYHPSKPFAFNVVPSVPLTQLALTTESELWAISEADQAIYHYNTITKAFDLEDDKELYVQITAGNSTIGVWALTNTHKIYKF
jgi:Tectonin domain